MVLIFFLSFPPVLVIFWLFSIFLSLELGKDGSRHLFVFLIVFSFVRSSAGSQLLVPVDWSRGSHGYSRGGTLLQLHP